MNSDTTYCIDACSLINLKKWHPIRRSERIWGHLGSLADDGRLISPREVYQELRGYFDNHDELIEWGRNHKEVFKHASLEVTSIVQKIIRRFPAIAKANSVSSTNADPWVVALANYAANYERLGQKCIVVTEERYVSGGEKIPNICEAFGLKYRTIHQMFMDEGWSFQETR